MSDEKDIVERLRADKPFTGHGGCQNCDDSLKEEAASLIERLRREVEERDALLKPFADAAEDLDDDHKDGSPIWEAPCAMNIDAGHLRAARRSNDLRSAK